MQMTATTHPPAGATALLAAVNDEVIAIGWYYLPVILLSSALVLVSALLINNIQRRYPVYWFEPHPHPPPAPKAASEKTLSRTPSEGDEAGIEAQELAEDRV